MLTLDLFDEAFDDLFVVRRDLPGWVSEVDPTNLRLRPSLYKETHFLYDLHLKLPIFEGPKADLLSFLVRALMTIKMSEKRTEAHGKFLKELWVQAKSMGVFYSFGVPSIDEEVREMWGDWNVLDEPFEYPFDTKPEESETMSNEQSAPAKDPNALSKWDANQVKEIREKARALPPMTDRELADRMWKRWQELTGPGKQKRIIAELEKEAGFVEPTPEPAPPQKKDEALAPPAPPAPPA